MAWQCYYRVKLTSHVLCMFAASSTQLNKFDCYNSVYNDLIGHPPLTYKSLMGVEKNGANTSRTNSPQDMACFASCHQQWMGEVPERSCSKHDCRDTFMSEGATR